MKDFTFTVSFDTKIDDAPEVAQPGQKTEFCLLCDEDHVYQWSEGCDRGCCVGWGMTAKSIEKHATEIMEDQIVKEIDQAILQELLRR